MKIRVMTADDYDSVAKLWTNSNGVGVNPDDSKENISKYLQRNPNTSFVAIENNEFVGAILAGHDGTEDLYTILRFRFLIEDWE